MTEYYFLGRRGGSSVPSENARDRYVGTGARTAAQAPPKPRRKPLPPLLSNIRSILSNLFSPPGGARNGRAPGVPPVQPTPPSRRRQRSLRIQALDARHGPRSSCPRSTPPLWGWDWILPRYLFPHRLPRHEKTPHLEATNVEGMGTCEFYKLWRPCWRRRTKEAEEGREALESGEATWTRFRNMRPELVPETRLATAWRRFYGCCICWTFGVCRMRSTAFWLWRRQEAKRDRSCGAPRHMSTSSRHGRGRTWEDS